MAEQNLPANSTGTGHELSDLSPKKIAWFAAGLALVIVTVLLVMYGLFHYFYRIETRRRPPPSPLSFGTEPPPEPRLLTKPGAELATMRAEEEQILKTYGWIDPDRGIVRMPIDRAIALLAEKGLPVRAGKNTEARATGKIGERKEKAKR